MTTLQINSGVVVNPKVVEEKELVIVIDCNVEEEKRIKELLQSKRYVAVINMHSTFPEFLKIKKLMEDFDFTKYFYGGSEEFCEEMVDKFPIKRGRIIYMGKRFNISRMI